MGIDSDDDLLVDCDFSQPRRAAPDSATRDRVAQAQQQQPRATPPQQTAAGVVDLTSDCEEDEGAAGASTPVPRRSPCYGSKRPADSEPNGGQRKRQAHEPPPQQLPRLPASRVTPRAAGDAASQPLPASRVSFRPAVGAASQPLPASRVVTQRPPLGDNAAGAAALEEQLPASRVAPKGTAAEERALKATQRKQEAEAKKAAKEAEKQEKARQRQLAKERKAAAKQAEKEQRQRQKEAVRQARGKFAEQQIKAVLSSELAMLPVGHQIMQSLTGKQYRMGIAAGALAPLATLQWMRSHVQGGSSQAAVGVAVAQDAEEEEVPYVLMYLKADDFVAEAENETLNALIRRAAAAHPACTLCLLVDGLYHYVELRERREFRQAGGAGATHTFLARKTNEAVMSLVTDYPGLRHRIVRDAAEAAEHVLMLTRALANQPYRVQDAFQELQTQGDGQASAALLVRNPLPPGQVALYQALSHVPALGPASAHVLATTFSTLGALMAAFLNPSRSEAEKLRMVSEVKQPGSGRRVGPAAAQKLLRLLLTRDPEAQIQD